MITGQTPDCAASLAGKRRLYIVRQTILAVVMAYVVNLIRNFQHLTVSTLHIGRSVRTPRLI